jgi:hypothetical protein
MELERLSDTELVDRFRTRDDRAAADELARRCLRKLPDVVRRLLYLCPPSEDRAAFVDDVVALAAEKVFTSLPTFRENFDRHIRVVAKSVALDHHKHLSTKKLQGRVPLETSDGEASAGVGGAAAEIRSACPSDDASALVRDGELARITKALLGLHAQKSEESAVAVRLMALDHSVEETAAEQARSPTTVRKLLVHDYPALRRLLLDRWNIRSLKEILED